MLPSNTENILQGRVGVCFLKYVTDFSRFFQANLYMLHVTYSHTPLSGIKFNKLLHLKMIQKLP